jgi:hypothetical protein
MTSAEIVPAGEQAVTGERSVLQSSPLSRNDSGAVTDDNCAHVDAVDIRNEADELQRLELIIAAATPPDHRRRRQQATEAAQHAKCCGQCGEPIESGDPIWRGRISCYSWSTYSHLMTALCDTCGRKRPAWVRQRPCVTCGRDVIDLDTVGINRRHATCCEDCANEARYARRRDRLAKARQKVCPTCDSEFIGSRSDSKFCSNACRQRAYRQRAATGGGR